jgi:hypothetical protein
MFENAETFGFATFRNEREVSAFQREMCLLDSGFARTFSRDLNKVMWRGNAELHALANDVAGDFA